MRKLIAIVWIVFCFSSDAVADDLYKVTLHSHHQAELLNAMNVEVLMSVRGGCLVLAGDNESQTPDFMSLDTELLVAGISRDQLAVDGRLDSKNADKFEILYEEGRVRLFRATADQLAMAGEKVEVFPLPQVHVKVTYNPPSVVESSALESALSDDVAAVMDLVLQDSLESYIYRLQAFTHRLTGTDSNYAARDWIASKFSEFGYDSVSIDPFVGSQLWDRISCVSYNVIGYKPGTVYPDKQIIVGAHFDAVPDCPGADDNGSGTALVLEIARVLSNLETNMSLVFIAFDSEESWMKGSIHYVEGVVDRNDDIVLMVNADMIGHWENDAGACLYHGPEMGYAELWSQLAGQYVGITGELASGWSSDSWPFCEAGYDILYTEEEIFSTVYHLPSDSASYLSFDYLTRMVKATLGTVYTVCQIPPPIRFASIQEPGDGHSLKVTWADFGTTTLETLRMSYYNSGTPWIVNSIDVAASEMSYTVDGLTEGMEYAFSIQGFDSEGQTSIGHEDPLYATPSSVPMAPHVVSVLPTPNDIQLIWNRNNSELDFSHWLIVRDGEIIVSTNDTTFIDNDPALGYDIHEYRVIAVDADANQSDTVGIEPLLSRLAALTPGRILAVNRSSYCPFRSADLVDETLTSVFIREALDGYDFDYYSDTAATVCGLMWDEGLNLYDMVDYELLVIGDETAGSDNFGGDPEFNGILDTLAYYLSIGGKAVIFGRWGETYSTGGIYYLANDPTYDDAYCRYFHIYPRVLTRTTTYGSGVQSDLVGAHPSDGAYPYLAWDSLSTLAHARDDLPTLTDVTGIPCVSFARLSSPTAEVIYSYDSRYDNPYSEGAPIAWRYIGPDYAYAWFEIPLSMFERSSAITALTQAVDDLMGISTHTEQNPSSEGLPDKFGLSQNYPNPFNPVTEICYSLPRASEVNLSVFNILGQKVTTLVNKDQVAGSHAVQWQGTDDGGQSVATGIYLYRLKADDFVQTKKMMLVK